MKSVFVSPLFLIVLMSYSGAAFSTICLTLPLEERLKQSHTVVLGRVKSCANSLKGSTEIVASDADSGKNSVGVASVHNLNACPLNQWDFEVERYIKDNGQLGEKIITVGSGLGPGNGLDQRFVEGQRLVLFLSETYQTGECTGNINLDLYIKALSSSVTQNDGNSALEFIKQRNHEYLQEQQQLHLQLQRQQIQQLIDFSNGVDDPFAPFWRVAETKQNCTLSGDAFEIQYQFYKSEQLERESVKFLGFETSNGEGLQHVKKHRLNVSLNPNVPPPAQVYINVDDQSYELHTNTIDVEIGGGKGGQVFRITRLFLSEQETLKTLDALSDPNTIVSITPDIRPSDPDWNGIINTTRFDNAKQEYLGCIANR